MNDLLFFLSNILLGVVFKNGYVTAHQVTAWSLALHRRMPIWRSTNHTSAAGQIQVIWNQQEKPFWCKTRHPTQVCKGNWQKANFRQDGGLKWVVMVLTLENPKNLYYAESMLESTLEFCENLCFLGGSWRIPNLDRLRSSPTES